MLPQLHPLQNCLARIYFSDKTRSNTPCGAGVVIDGKILLTCAHVVKVSLGLSRDILEKPEQSISMDFPLAKVNKRVSAKVVFWDLEADIAGLEFIEEIPEEVIPVFLHKTDHLLDNPIRAFGFPGGYPKGTWAKGELRGPIDPGWIEIVDSQLTGHFVQQGFSGGPVWDERLQCCIGIVVAVDSIASSRTSYLIPTVVIADKWRELSVKTIHRKIRSVQASEFPPLLPYQVNCWNQKKLLEDIYENSKSNSPKPIVVLVHGNADQAHDMFLKRLIYEFIPTIINSKFSPNNIHFRWPSEINAVKDLHKGFTKNLGEQVLYKSTASCDEIQNALASDSRPAIVDTELTTDEWMKHKSGILEAFLDYWQSWPDLKSQQNLFVFLFLSHKTSEKNYISNLRYTYRKKQILTQIGHCGFHHYPRIVGAVMPELIGISQPDVEEWVRTQARDYFGDDLTMTFSKIRKLYERQEVFPMEALAFHLKEILTASSGD